MQNDPPTEVENKAGLANATVAKEPTAKEKKIEQLEDRKVARMNENVVIIQRRSSNIKT